MDHHERGVGLGTWVVGCEGDVVGRVPVFSGNTDGEGKGEEGVNYREDGTAVRDG